MSGLAVRDSAWVQTCAARPRALASGMSVDRHEDAERLGPRDAVRRGVPCSEMRSGLGLAETAAVRAVCRTPNKRRTDPE